MPSDDFRLNINNGISLSNVRLRWKADVQKIQLECPLNTESGRSDVM